MWASYVRKILSSHRVNVDSHMRECASGEWIQLLRTGGESTFGVSFYGCTKNLGLV